MEFKCNHCGEHITDDLYIITDIPVVGTFCSYAVNSITGKSICIRCDWKENGHPKVVSDEWGGPSTLWEIHNKNRAGLVSERR